MREYDLTEDDRKWRYEFHLKRNYVYNNIENPIIYIALLITLFLCIFNQYISIIFIISFHIFYCFFLGSILQKYAEKKFLQSLDNETRERFLKIDNL